MAKTIQCTVVTPERKALDQTVDFVVLPLYDGEIGIAPDHAPLIGRLGYGEMRLRRGAEVSRFYVDGGFVQVVGNHITVLTAQAVPADDIDREAAQQQLDAARGQPASTDEQRQIRDRTVAQARGRLRVARQAHP
ncbi:MAG: ATP synthase F1 subunit epsilon [Candidatus Anammoximicrobium sp.]|nr:ATP synthase F1 subunit epsilon [Candidatus Anammoximicrobium sp.]